MLSRADSRSAGATKVPEPCDQARVSVVVPVRNRLAITTRFLEQISRQTHPNLRVIVVDSNSSDGTPEAVRQAFPAVIVMAAWDQDYWAGATNRGVRHALAAGTEWILTINDDAVISEDHVERLLKIAKRHGCRILGSQINHLSDPETIWSLGTYTSWGSENLLRLGYTGYCNGQRPSEILGQEVLPVDALAGNGVLVHHSVYRQIGLYNDRWLPHYHADSEFVMRAVAQGIGAWVTPLLILLNDFHVKQKSLPLRSMRGLLWSFGHPRSHLYAPSLFYMIIVYCPNRFKLRALVALLKRFDGLRRASPKTPS